MQPRTSGVELGLEVGLCGRRRLPGLVCGSDSPGAIGKELELTAVVHARSPTTSLGAAWRMRRHSAIVSAGNPCGWRGYRAHPSAAGRRFTRMMPSRTTADPVN
jgi:hypothetical protein